MTAVQPEGRYGAIKMDAHNIVEFYRKTQGRWNVD